MSRPSNAETRAVLRSRVVELARPQRDDADDAQAAEVLAFTLGQERYALEIRHVKEVIPLRELTSIPCTPPFVTGVVKVRGRISAVIDIRKFFALPDRGITDMHYIILIQSADLALGLLVDGIVGIERLTAEKVQTSLPTFSGIRADFLKGMTADHTAILDLNRILVDPRILVHEEVRN